MNLICQWERLMNADMEGVTCVEKMNMLMRQEQNCSKPAI
jgi:hypothetical protein